MITTDHAAVDLGMTGAGLLNAGIALYAERSGGNTGPWSSLTAAAQRSYVAGARDIVAAYLSAAAADARPAAADDADEDDEQCEGHESLAGEHMGEAVYCPNDECVTSAAAVGAPARSAIGGGRLIVEPVAGMLPLAGGDGFLF